MLAGFSHTVRVHEVLEDKHCYYLVLELCKGGELFDHILAKVGVAGVAWRGGQGAGKGVCGFRRSIRPGGGVPPFPTRNDGWSIVRGRWGRRWAGCAGLGAWGGVGKGWLGSGYAGWRWAAHLRMGHCAPTCKGHSVRRRPGGALNGQLCPALWEGGEWRRC